MPAKIKINFLSSELDGQTMGLIVLANEKTIFRQDNGLNKTFTIDFDVDVPAEIKFIVSGKGPFDTKVDAHGNIIQDKFLKINSILIDRMPVPLWTLESKFIQFVCNQQITYTNYFCYNGYGVIRLPSDIFSLFLSL